LHTRGRASRPRGNIERMRLNRTAAMTGQSLFISYFFYGAMFREMLFITFL
jgi:hypothetical protein